MRIARHNEVVTLVFNTFKEMYNVTTWQEHQLLSKWADGLIEILGSAILIEVTVSEDIDWQYPQKLYNQLHAVVEEGSPLAVSKVGRDTTVVCVGVKNEMVYF